LIKFFKINDPYRLVLLAIIFLAIRSILFYFDFDFTFQELKFFIAAKAINQGKWLYRDIWETTDPLTTLFYSLLPSRISTFKNTTYWINVILILFNSLYVNYFLQKFDILNSKSHLPAFFYLFFSLTVFELNSFSSPLLASTLLLFMVSNLLAYFKKEEPKRLYDASFCLGIASLFYLPSICFFIITLFSVIVFTREIAKSTILLFIGALFPWIIISILFLWQDGLIDLYQIFLFNYFSQYKNFIVYNELWTILLAPGFAIITITIFSLNNNIREINYQSVCRRFFVIWLIGGLITFSITPFKSFASIHLLILPLTYFLSYYTVNLKRTDFSSLALLICIVVMVTFQIRSLKGISLIKSRIKISIKTPEAPGLIGKKIWVAGDSISYYLHSKVATKYLNWDVSKIDFDNTKEFSAIENIRTNFHREMPEIIIDQNRIMPTIFKRIPELATQYHEQKTGYYILNIK
jgi:hypothetical protein